MKRLIGERRWHVVGTAIVFLLGMTTGLLIAARLGRTQVKA